MAHRPFIVSRLADNEISTDSGESDLLVLLDVLRIRETGFKRGADFFVLFGIPICPLVVKLNANMSIPDFF